MKKLSLFIVLLISIQSFAQSWKYESGGNAFDGKFKTAYTIGKGTEYPYQKPMLTINMFNEDVLNFYIVRAGFFQSEASTNVLWVFDNEPSIIYQTSELTISNDGKTVFLNGFTNTSNGLIISQFDFIQKLKTANKVDVRISDNYGKNDISFNLNGSSNAIKYVISDIYLEYIRGFNEERARIIEEYKLINEREVKAKENLSSLLANYALRINEIENLTKKIIRNSYSEQLNLDSIKSLSLDATNQLKPYLNLFNSNGQSMYILENISEDIPYYLSKVKVESLKKDSIYISNLMSKYDFTAVEKMKLTDAVLKLAKSHSISISQFDTLIVTLPSKFIDISTLDLYNSADKSKLNVSFANLLIPTYIDKLLQIRKNDLAERILFLSKRYMLTSEEEAIIIKKFMEDNVVKILPSDITNTEVLINSKIPYLTKINLLNTYNKNLHSIIIVDKEFMKQLKRKISKLKLD
jgi:hypothetical protein